MSAFLMDTSGERGFIALTKDQKITDVRFLQKEDMLSKSLMLNVQALFKKSRIKVEDLHFVGAGVGPGNYTSTRTSIAITRGIAFAKKIPLVGFFPFLILIPPTLEGNFSFVIFEDGENITLARGVKKGKNIALKPTPIYSINVKKIQEETGTLLLPLNFSKKENLKHSDIIFYDSDKPNVNNVVEYSYQQFKSGKYSKELFLEILYKKHVP